MSRHQGAIEWAKRYHWGQRLQYVQHLDVCEIKAGDIVIGTLPINLVAEINERGAHYLHLTINLAAIQRGKELTADDLEAAGARLSRYRAAKITSFENLK